MNAFSRLVWNTKPVNPNKKKGAIALKRSCDFVHPKSHAGMSTCMSAFDRARKQNKHRAIQLSLFFIELNFELCDRYLAL
jgi:hypothetical protein